MATPQMWLFLRENMAITQFSLQHAFVSDILNLTDNKPSLEDLAERAIGEKTPIDDLSFWMHSASMKAAVQLLSDDAIRTTWHLYCRFDEVVTIYVRNLRDDSPNTSRTPSHNLSLRAIRKISGSRKVSEVVLRPQLHHRSKSIDSLTGEPVENLSEPRKVILDLGKGEKETFSKDYLLGWIGAEISSGRLLTDIVVETRTRNGRPIRIPLNKDVWMTSLIRGPHANEFRGLWDKGEQIAAKKQIALYELQEMEGFHKSAVDFIRDLRTFGRDEGAQQRLNATKHEFYLGPPYFNSTTVEKILALPTYTGTLGDHLRALADRKVERDEGQEFCAAHDLSPLFERAFGIDWTKEKSKENKGYKRDGLAGKLKKRASKMLGK